MYCEQFWTKLINVVYLGQFQVYNDSIITHHKISIQVFQLNLYKVVKTIFYSLFYCVILSCLRYCTDDIVTQVLMTLQWLEHTNLEFGKRV